MKKDEKGRWFVTNPLEFIGWIVESIEITEGVDTAVVILVHKITNKKREVITNKINIPLSSIERNDKR